MPDATITSTASTFGTISGVFSADQSTISGTISGVVPGTLTGSVGVPGPAGPAGPGVPAGGTAGQYLQKIDGVDYNTDWVTLNLSAYAPLNSPAFTGNPTAPTAALGDNDTSLATTAFVQQELASGVAVAKNLEVYVRNQSGSTIPAGSIVYISGATGNKPLITKAQANNDANSAQTMGFTKESIANNGFGYVIVRGELENIDTSALTEGVQLYLSPTTAGTWTTTKPSAPQHLVYVGIVVRAHPTQGIILVAVQNGYELNELHDVKITSASNGQVLKYDSAQGLWVNGTDVGGVAWGGITGTLSSQTDLQTALDGKYSTSNPAGYITSSALSPYLLSSTAASTYATILEPSVDGILTVEPSGSNTATLQVNQDANNYIHLRAGVGQIAMVYGGTTKWFFNDTYLQFPGGTQQTVAYPGSSGFLLKADNLSGLANTGTARTNLGLGTMAVETASNYLTTATASSTYAPLASPALTGTPTAPTATLGTNTTQIATTAFVLANAPSTSFATDAQALALTSNTVSISPLTLQRVIMHPSFRRITSMAGNSVSTTSGTGSSNYVASNWIENIGPSSGSTGSAMVTPANVAGFDMIGRLSEANIDFSKRIILCGKFGQAAASGYLGDANNFWMFSLGKASAYAGNFTGKAIGIRKFGSTANFFLVVHNGTTLTAVDSGVSNNSFSATTDFTIISDGSGNVTLFINDSQVATTSAGPTGSVTNGSRIYVEVNQVGTFGARIAAHTGNIGIYVAP